MIRSLSVFGVFVKRGAENDIIDFTCVTQVALVDIGKYYLYVGDRIFKISILIVSSLSRSIYSSKVKSKFIFETSGLEMSVTHSRLKWECCVQTLMRLLCAADLTCGDFNSPAASIVDSGTTDLLLPQKVFDAVVAELYTYLPADMPNTTKHRYFYPGTEKTAIPQTYAANFPTVSITFPVANSPHEAFDVVLQTSDYLRLRYSRAVCIAQYHRLLGRWTSKGVVQQRINCNISL